MNRDSISPDLFRVRLEDMNYAKTNPESIILEPVNFFTLNFLYIFEHLHKSVFGSVISDETVIYEFVESIIHESKTMYL